MFIEDPLSEELLRGTFEGKNLIRVELKEVGDEKQLEFHGEYVEPAASEEELEPVGAGAGDDAGNGE